MKSFLALLTATAACLIMVLGAKFIAIGVRLLFLGPPGLIYDLLGGALPIVGLALVIFGGAFFISVAREAPT
jgi:hypothetical protein